MLGVGSDDDTSLRSLQLRAAIRWLGVPWSAWSLAAALALAFAAPVFLVGSVDVWRAASADDLTRRSVADVSLERNGVDIAVESEFSLGAAEAADREVKEALDGISAVGSVASTAYTFTGLLAVGPSPLRQVGPVGRLLSQAGAIEAADVVAQLGDTSDGIWISTWFADRLGVDLGDVVAFEGGSIDEEAWNDLVQGGVGDSGFRVVGFYEPLWSTDPEATLAEYWSSVPPELLPVYVAPFNQPNFELILTDDSTLLHSDLTGVLRWRAPLTSIPTTFDELRGLRAELRDLERALVVPGSLAESMAGVATSAQRRPVLTTDLFETTSGVESAARRLVAPLASARALGAAVGVAAVFGVGIFFVERRRSEFRLLASEGERWFAMTGRVAAQLAAPAIAGAVIGAAMAVIGPWWFGPAAGSDFSVLPLTAIGVTAIVSLLLAAVTAGVMGARTLSSPSRETVRTVGRVLVGALVVATAIAWTQVRRTTAAGETSLDLVVVALPVLVIGFVVLVLVAGLAWVVRVAGRGSERLPVEVFLAARRLASGSLAVRLVAGSLGLGIGLIVFALAITSTLDRTLDVKLATSVGGVSSAVLLDPLPSGFQAPSPTTVIRESDTRLTPGNAAARIIAIDPSSYGDAVTWSDEFGIDVDELLDALAGPTDQSIPVIAIEGEPVPRVGAFGLARTYPYRVVATVRGFPTAGNRNVSILASADAIDAYASAGDESEAAPSPLESFRSTAVSQATAEELTVSLDTAGVRFRDVASEAALRQSPSIVATRSAFGFLGVIGVAAGAAALVAMGLFLAARRRSSALTGVIVRSMGLSTARSALVSAIELGAVLVVSVGAGLIAAPLVVRELAPRFDPAPGRPPEVSVFVDWTPMLMAAFAGVVIVSALVWLSEWRDSRRPAGAVVRDGD